jgi:hypothetical protein
MRPAPCRFAGPGSIGFSGPRRCLPLPALFAVAGPVFGLFTLVAGAFLASAWSAFLANAWRASLSGVMWMFINAVGAVPFAYLLGAVPAAVAGFLVAICREWMGRAPWWSALAIGIVVGVAFTYFLERPPASSPAPRAPVDHGFRLLLVVTNVVPTMLCWWIVRNWFVRKELTT